MPRSLTLILCLIVALVAAPAGADAAWRQPVGGASPLNQSPSDSVDTASTTVIGGVPYVAWSENDGSNYEVRVSRLNAAGTAWEQVVGGPSPINHASNRDALGPSLTAIGGVPYVAWVETDGVNYEVRVSRLNAAGTAWVQLVGGASPINNASNRDGFEVSLTAIDGIPYVAWTEFDGMNEELRVSRLNANGTAWVQVVGGASTINHASDKSADDPSLTAIGDIPYVAWVEGDGLNYETRVSRLNATGTAWEQVVGGTSPINQSNDRNAFHPSLTAIGGVPHVAWTEIDGTNFEVRVSRLNAAGTAWVQLVGGASPINHASNRDAAAPSLTAIGNTPYVAWTEFDGTNNELRVSRLNAGTAWEQVVGGDSPVNQASTRNAYYPDLTAIGGVPYVAWGEVDEANRELRVSRLEPEFLAQTATAGAGGVTLEAQVRTFGVAYPIGFEYGRDSSFGSATAPQTVTSGNTASATVSQTIGTLSPGSVWRPFATDLVRRTAFGQTLTVAAPSAAGAGPGAARPAGATAARVTLKLATRRIPAKGPLPVVVSNASGVTVGGKLSGQTARKVSVAAGTRRRLVELGTTSFRVRAHARETVRLRLPKSLRRVLKREGKVSLRLAARVSDSAGPSFTVRKTVTAAILRRHG